MDWNNVEPDAYMLLPQSYTPGRQGHSISGITLHHNAGNLSASDCYNVWCNAGTSAHYQVDSSGTITQLVNDSDTAWACGNWEANLDTISIEHANNNSDPWTIWPQTLDAGAHLVAALCRHYGLGRPEWMVNVFPHKHWSSTACPGEIAGSQRDEYMSRAQAYYDDLNADLGEVSEPDSNWAPPERANDVEVNVHYAFHALDGGWLPEVVNFNNSDDDGYAGNPYERHDMLIAWVDHGYFRYRVHCEGLGWLDWVDHADYNDPDYGMAGAWGYSIDGVQCYYTTPDGETFKRAYYRSQTVAREGYLGVCSDDGTNGDGLDGWAGVYGEPMDRLQIAIAGSNPF